MAYDPSWERIHSERPWGSYPKEELVRFIFGRGGPKPRGRVLDLGSGQGASTWFLAREGFSPVAIDCSLSALQKARSKLEHEGLPYQGVQGELTQLPFMADSFDAVIDVVSSAHNTRNAMAGIFKEVSRILKPGGSLFSVLPTNRCSRRTFKGLTATFLEECEVEDLLSPYLNDLMILKSSYQLSRDCLIENWIATGKARS